MATKGGYAGAPYAVLTYAGTDVSLSVTHDGAVTFSAVGSLTAAAIIEKSGEFATVGDRITQASDQRIIEAGDQRIIEQPNIGVGTIAADGTRTAFVGQESVNYSGTWYEPATSVNYLGTWYTPAKGYVNDNGIWARIL